MKKTKLILTSAALAGALTLSSCSNTQMAVTGLALAGTALAAGTYAWMKHPDAYNAYQADITTVSNAVKQVLAKGNYNLTKQEIENGEYDIKATSPTGDETHIIINSKNGQTSVFIKDDSKSNATILLNQINALVK